MSIFSSGHITEDNLHHFFDDHLLSLNPLQRRAVETLEGPLLVLAGAGTGKTRVLTTRMAYILFKKKAWPSQILAVTFTNKAAQEMRERVRALVGQQLESPWTGTFHSIGVRLLRRHGELVGLKSNFTILDTDDQLRLMKQLVKARDLDEKNYPSRVILATIQKWKDRAYLPEEVHFHLTKGFERQYLELYKEYQERLQILNAVDFGDLILLTLKLFTRHPDVLQIYHRQFLYILVDEYQDINVAQYLWLRLLSQGTGNLCCVGDDDQSIYGWRGAEVDNILRFDQDFPQAQVIRLEHNYRSTSHILQAASHLIGHNKRRLGKDLKSHYSEGQKVIVKGTWDPQEEARWIGERIEDLQNHGHALASMAILVRAGFQTREFEERLITLGIPYRIIGGVRFYERLEIRDALAYLRITHQLDDSLAFERILNTPKRGIGTSTLQEIHQYARQNHVSLFKAASYLVQSEALRKSARVTLRSFLMMIQRWNTKIEEEKPGDLARLILDESGYTEFWQKEKSIEAAGRLENLKELVKAIDEFESLGNFLEHVSLVSETTQSSDEDMVLLMTLHAAKGLEFESVFLAGWEEGLFPHGRNIEENGEKGLEEERRLAYVGLTRAKRQAFISFVWNRRHYQGWQSCAPSRFIDELPKEHVDLFIGKNTTYSSPPRPSLHHVIFEQPDNISALNTKGCAESHFFQRGQKVFHLKFGYGWICSVQGDHLDIDFECSGRKKILASFVQNIDL